MKAKAIQIKKESLIWFIPLFAVYMIITGNVRQIPRFVRGFLNKR